MTEVTAGPALGPGVAGESALRVCKRPGCGNPVPWSGRGRIRLFCGDACSRRFHAGWWLLAGLRCHRSRPVTRWRAGGADRAGGFADHAGTRAGRGAGP